MYIKNSMIVNIFLKMRRAIPRSHYACLYSFECIFRIESKCGNGNVNFDLKKKKVGEFYHIVCTPHSRNTVLVD